MSITKDAKVYKIVCSQSNDVYVGSTFNTLRDRMYKHKTSFNQWMKDKTKSKCAIYPLFEKYGFDKFKIILIKEYAVCDRSHLEVYEALWISKTECVNQVVPFRIAKLYKKQYYEDNKDKAVAYMKQYYEKNKDVIKEKNLEKKQCDCGGKYSRVHRARHFKTKKHIQWAQSN